MAEEKIDGDFTACSVDVLNRFFAAYRNSHSQGGTNTRQRNQHHLFKWLALRYDHPDPWTDGQVGEHHGGVTAAATGNAYL
jgi:integrase/recombinase XerD